MFELHTQIYLDGLSEKQINETFSDEIHGYTFNPTLFKNLGVENYLDECQKFVNLVKGKPISLEVTGDDEKTIIRQARLLAQLGDNVYVKIPVTYTDGNYTTKVIQHLTEEEIKMNITAIFTIDQIKEVLGPLRETENIISVFAGRLYDIGLDAKKLMKEMGHFIHRESNCRILWASPRMSFDLFSADNAKTDIITMSMPIYEKLFLINKDPTVYSLETVKMFFDDAKKSGYIF